MKIKNSLTNLKTGPLMTVFLSAALVSAAVRCVQMVKFIEPETGFTVGANWLMILLYVVLLGCCATFCVVSFLSKDTENHQPEGVADKFAGVAGIFFAVALLFDWIGSFFSWTSAFGVTTAPGIKGMMASGLLTGFLQSIFGFLSMFYMFILAFDLKRGTQKATKFKILAIAPVGWAAVRLVHRFIRQISFLEVSDLFLELIMLSFMVMFFMALAQVVSGVNSTGFSWRLTGFGLSAALISFALYIPRLIFTFASSGYINSEHRFCLADFAFAFFAAALVLSLNKTQKED